MSRKCYECISGFVSREKRFSCTSCNGQGCNWCSNRGYTTSFVDETCAVCNGRGDFPDHFHSNTDTGNTKQTLKEKKGTKLTGQNSSHTSSEVIAGFISSVTLLLVWGLVTTKQNGFIGFFAGLISALIVYKVTEYILRMFLKVLPAIIIIFLTLIIVVYFLNV